MHSGEPKIRDIYYGADDQNLYIRLDTDDGFQFDSLELRTGDKTISLLNNPSVHSARKRIFEIRILEIQAGWRASRPELHETGQRAAGQFRVVVNGAELPPDTWLET